MRREEAVRRAREESESERQEEYDQRMMEDYERRLEEGSETKKGPTLEELKRRVELYSYALARSESQRVHPSTLEQFRKDYRQVLDDYNRKKLGGK